jgi:uncharacterized YccA/Bax inhibitor family protein
MLGFTFKEPSTIRGLVLLIFSIVAAVMVYQGKDASPILAASGILVGLIGAVTKDQTKQVSDLARTDTVVTKE